MRLPQGGLCFAVCTPGYIASVPKRRPTSDDGIAFAGKSVPVAADVALALDANPVERYSFYALPQSHRN